MQLARIRRGDGRVAIGLVDGDAVAVLAASNEHSTLAQILESSDPAAVVRSLTGKGAR